MLALTGASVKICGINSAASFDAVVEAGADFLGFVFFPPSPRYVTPAQAAALSVRHLSGPQRVGLFVKPSAADIEAVLSEVKLDILQIHAPPAEAAALKRQFGLPLWRSLGISSPADFPEAEEPTDGYVAEAKPPPGATRPGGNAVQADWELLARWRPEKFWLLAGGLRPDNVAEALRITGAPGADVSSGVETAPGQKSPALIRTFVEAVRSGR
ncbi:phosphoribosylanthranilate isomerase [Acidocella sp.]|uniref:phosphoribosylanthranilate isomerase n=1 Tax=Acidocella sp. TaxID=50710 RepID=UPI002F3ED383